VSRWPKGEHFGPLPGPPEAQSVGLAGAERAVSAHLRKPAVPAALARVALAGDGWLQRAPAQHGRRAGANFGPLQGSAVPVGRFSQIYDVLNGVVLDADLFPLHRQPAFAGMLLHSVLVAEHAAACVASLPMHPSLADNDLACIVRHVADGIHWCCGRKELHDARYGKIRQHR
jgi:hypothetical protein